MVLAKNDLGSYPGPYLLIASPIDMPPIATGAIVLAGPALMVHNDSGPPPKTNGGTLKNKIYYLQVLKSIWAERYNADC